MLHSSLRLPDGEPANGEPAQVPALLHEWRSALQGLFQLVREALAEDLAAGRLTIVEGSLAVTEQRLGRYEAPTLAIRSAGGAEAELRPVARVVFGGEGRVDLLAGARRTILVRREGAWFVLRAGAGRRPQMTPLDPDALKSLLAALLR